MMSPAVTFFQSGNLHHSDLYRTSVTTRAVTVVVLLPVGKVCFARLENLEHSGLYIVFGVACSDGGTVLLHYYFSYCQRFCSRAVFTETGNLHHSGLYIVLTGVTCSDGGTVVYTSSGDVWQCVCREALDPSICDGALVSFHPCPTTTGQQVLIANM